jgi:hypothetical protein
MITTSLASLSFGKVAARTKSGADLIKLFWHKFSHTCL